MPGQQLARPAISRWPVLFLGLVVALTSCSQREATEPNPSAKAADIDEACRQMSAWLARRLGPSAHTLVRAPLVVAGDLPPAELALQHDAILFPAMQAMAAQYFDKTPDAPICIVLAAKPESYQRWAQAMRLSAVEDLSDNGYYDPNLRLILVDASRGPAAVWHELTHALMDFDFSAAPLWLREGLASLHEACELAGDPPRIVGQAGPRGDTLADALRHDRLLPLDELCRAEAFAAAVRAERYAQSRYFCLYLQQQAKLSSVYRALRRGPTDSAATLKACGAASWTELDADFRRFLDQLLPAN